MKIHSTLIQKDLEHYDGPKSDRLLGTASPAGSLGEIPMEGLLLVDVNLLPVPPPVFGGKIPLTSIL